MIAPPATGTPPRLGPLSPAGDDELEAAWPELAHETLALTWLAEVRGVEVARLEALARAGELLVVPGPWPLRQAYRTGLGYLVPAWQLAPGAREALPALLEAAAARGWTSLELHRFATSPQPPLGTTPAQLLREGAAAQVLALVRGGAEPTEAPTPPRRRRVRAVPAIPLRHHEAAT